MASEFLSRAQSEYTMAANGCLDLKGKCSAALVLNLPTLWMQFNGKTPVSLKAKKAVFSDKSFYFHMKQMYSKHQ